MIIEIFSGLPHAKLKGSAHVLISEGRGKNLDMFLLRPQKIYILVSGVPGNEKKFQPGSRKKIIQPIIAYF